MSAAAVVASPQDLAQQVAGWDQIARTLEVIDQPSLQRAGNYILAVKALQQQADETFDPIIRKAHEAHKEAIAQKKRITDPLVQAETTLKSKVGEHLERERQAREEEERRLRAEAERLAAEQREAEIEEAEAAGATGEEISVLAQAPLYVPPVVRAAAPKVNGIIQRESWRAEVTDLLALVRYAGQNPQFLNLLQPNPVALGAMARTMRGTMNVPGVRAIRENGVAVRSRA
jgi:DNA repair exonuclease SbcCD ATPase subunit